MKRVSSFLNSGVRLDTLRMKLGQLVLGAIEVGHGDLEDHGQLFGSPHVGECRSRSYWFIRALAENSSIPTSMPNCFCEYPALILAALSRVPSIHTTPVPLARSAQGWANLDKMEAQESLVFAVPEALSSGAARGFDAVYEAAAGICVDVAEIAHAPVFSRRAGVYANCIKADAVSSPGGGGSSSRQRAGIGAEAAENGDRDDTQERWALRNQASPSRD